MARIQAHKNQAGGVSAGAEEDTARLRGLWRMLGAEVGSRLMYSEKSRVLVRSSMVGTALRGGLILVLIAVAGVQSSRAGETRLGVSCDLALFGQTEKATFLAFDRELRAALKAKDPLAMAFLVRYPLKLNHDDGSTTSLGNPRAIQTRFEVAFPEAVRKAVIDQGAKDLFCNDSGIMYGSGQVWVTPTTEGALPRYRIWAVNLPPGDEGAVKAGEPALEFVCDTEELRAAVNSNADGVYHYRAWTKPHFVLDPPDVEVKTGKIRSEGTGPCAYSIWTFESGDSEISVSELGCTEGPVDDDMKGYLTERIHDKEKTFNCY